MTCCRASGCSQSRAGRPLLCVVLVAPLVRWLLSWSRGSHCRISACTGKDLKSISLQGRHVHVQLAPLRGQRHRSLRRLGRQCPEVQHSAHKKPQRHQQVTVWASSALMGAGICIWYLGVSVSFPWLLTRTQIPQAGQVILYSLFLTALCSLSDTFLFFSSSHFCIYRL